MMKKTILILMLFVVLSVSVLSACGRISKPIKPKDSEYMKEYTVKP